MDIIKMDDMRLSSMLGLQDISTFSKDFLSLYNNMLNMDPAAYYLIANTLKKEIERGKNFRIVDSLSSDDVYNKYKENRKEAVIIFMQATVDFLEKTGNLKEKLYKEKGWN